MRIYIIMILLIVPVALAVDECPRFGTIQQDIPCIQPSSYKPGSCDFNLTIYDEGGFPVLNTTWFEYSPFCAFNLTNLTSTGTYCYNSSLESGCITLRREDNMLAITLAIGFIVTFFILMGFVNQNFPLKIFSFGIGLIEIITMFSLLYARELGKDISNLMMVNFYALILIGFGIGMISLILYSLRTVDLTDTKEVEKKWENDKWGR